MRGLILSATERRRVRLATALLAVGLVACGARAVSVGAAPAAAPSQATPRLVVMLVVDQLSEPLLERYADVYSGGLRRLLDGGYRYTRATHDHAYTETAAGHAALSTATFPSRNGIVGNEWREQVGNTWRLVYCMADSLSPIVGYPASPGRSSANLLRPGLADWVQATYPGAQIVTVSRKDRSAIALAGKTKGQAYWILSAAGRFVTSAFYGAALPPWVARFNAEQMPRFYADSVWRSEVPARLVSRARPDSAAYEGDGVHVVFPHVFGAADGQRTAAAFNTWVTEATPFADAAVVALARTAVAELGLGADDVPDFLGVSLSQTDAVGHDYGPFSLEQLDNLLRLDRLLGELFGELDRRVGPGRWVLGMSADHGIMIEPEYVLAQGGQAHRLTQADNARVRDAVAAATNAGGTPQEIRDRAAAALRQVPLIAGVYAWDSYATPADSFAVLYRNSNVPGRAMGSFYRLGLDVRYVEGTIALARGTTHGSPYLYDRNVPLLIYGPAVAPGSSDAPARTVDLAPTLATLAGVRFPGDLDGRPLTPARR
jgi:predicted AlkP superfamily pyrophosphatase or phosphodiesterase